MTADLRRIEILDVLRGFALCGILLVNIGPVTHMGYDAVAALGPDDPPPAPHPAETTLHMLVDGRFFPIFAFLFGIGFAVFLDAAGRRHDRPRLPLVRRLLALAVIGGLHAVVHPGEALLPYAVAGLVVLLPASYLPRWAVLAGGVVATVLGVAVAGGGVLLVPGMFLLGLATARYRVPQRLDRLTPHVAVAFALSVAASVPAALWQWGEVAHTGFSASSAVAGLAMATMYVTGMCLLARSPLGGALRTVFVPLGRMALTNYVSATLVVLLVGWLLDFSAREQWGALFTLAGALLAAQWVFSSLWLRRFRYGPLEWAWRRVTWWSPVPNTALPRRPAPRPEPAEAA